MKGRRFGLLGRFAVLSAVLIVALGSLLGAALHRSVRNRALNDAIRTGEVATNIGIRPLVRPDDLDRDFVPLQPERLAGLDEALEGTLSDSGGVRFKLWNRQHWLVYSDNPDLIGRWFPSSDSSTPASRARSGRGHRPDRPRGARGAGLRHPPRRVRAPPGGSLGAFTTDGSGEVAGAFEVYLPYAPVADYRAAVEDGDFSAAKAVRVDLDTLAHELAAG